MAEAENEEATPEVIADILSLVTEVTVPATVIATWTPGDREDAIRWAGAEHLSASDNPVRRTEPPELVRRAVEVVKSPAMAQIAVEEWLRVKERYEKGEFRSWDEAADTLLRTAQDAITGLLVLLGGSGDVRLTWREATLRIMRAHKGGIREVDLMGMLGEGCPPRDVLLGWLRQEEAAGIVERELSGGGTWRLREARPS